MSKSNRWDFSGWATKTNMRCSDGRTIKKDAFKGCDGIEVPLVWNHRHNDPSEVLGHALLENRDDGVYAYCSFNDSEKGMEAKELVRHGDIKSLSIYANQLVQSSKTPPCDVIHGMIREVSLVLAGANPGAFIDNVLIHGELVEDEAEIFHSDNDKLYIYHSDEDDEDEDEDEDLEEESKKEDDKMSNDKTIGDVLETLNKEQKAAVGILIQQALENQKDIKHSDEPDDDEEDANVEDEPDDGSEDGETLGDVIKTLTPKQRKAVEALVGMALSQKENGKSISHAAEDEDEDEDEDAEEEADDGETIGDVIKTLTPKQRTAVEALFGMATKNNKDDSDEEEDNTMKHNVFDTYEDNAPVISHADQSAVIELAKSVGSLKRAVEMSVQEGGALAHAITDHNDDSITYGVANIDYMFPDARMIGTQPELISKNQDWVDKVINGTHHTPFSRVKSLFADITGEDARARGYVKGKQKVEEVIEALHRETTPQTIYKKQKLDRDDIVDITDFDVVAWLKAEMQIMLKAEIARAILIGDGRPAGDDKIREANVRPIYNDNDLYTVKVPVAVEHGAKDSVKAAGVIDATIVNRYQYKGSGNPTLFIDQRWLGQMLILKDGMGHRLYETRESLAAAMDVKEIVAVDVMDGQTIAIPTGQGSATANKPLVGIIVNLQDYNVGADKGGATSFFDDFDIDYNQYKYLYETRMSGALVKPYSAMSIYIDEAAA